MKYSHTFINAYRTLLSAVAGLMFVYFGIDLQFTNSIYKLLNNFICFQLEAKFSSFSLFLPQKIY